MSKEKVSNTTSSESEDDGMKKFENIRKEWLVGDNSLKPIKSFNLENVVECINSVSNTVTFNKPVPLNELLGILTEMWEEGNFYFS
jgi:hypothetical protein